MPGAVVTKSEYNRHIKEARKAYDQGKEDHKSEKFGSAVNNFHEAVLLHESLLGKYHQDTIKSYWRLGKAACMSDEKKRALQAFHRAIRMGESSFDDRVKQIMIKDVETCWRERNSEDDQSLGKIMEILKLEQDGDAASKKKNFQEACECYQRAIDTQDSLYGDDSLDGADLRVKLACCMLRSSNKLTDAQQIFLRAHDCYIRVLGEHHPATYGAAACMKSLQDANRKDAMKNGKNWISAASLSSLGSAKKSQPSPLAT